MSNKSMRTIELIIMALIYVQMLFTGILIYNDLQGKTFCVSGLGCNEVQNSSFGEIGGVKLSIVGFMSFTFLLLIFLLTYEYERGHHWFLIATIIGSLGAAYFIFLQVFIIKAFCSSCMAIDMLMIIIALYAIYDYINHKRHIRHKI